MATTVEQLRTGGKRVRTHDAQMVFKLPSRAKDLVGEIAEGQQVSEAHIARDAIAEYLEKRGYRL